MIRNYIKTAWRNFLHNKSYAAINIIGLAIGIAACLLIFLVVHFETGFDTFHLKKDRIYRVITAAQTPQGMDYGSGVPLPTVGGLRNDFPGLLTTAVFRVGGQITVMDDALKQQKKIKEKSVYFSDPQFFSVFDFDWLAGDKKNALAQPNNVVLTQDAARQYFGNWQAAMGKTIKFENKNLLKVAGIIKTMPANTDLKLKVIISFATVKNTSFNNNINDWVSTFGGNHCFVVLPANTTQASFEKNLAVFVKKHKPADYVKDGLILQPLTQMHYDDRVNIFDGKTFSKDRIGVLYLIGFFLLIIACVNFINLATAQAVNRSKEVGIRKVLGSNRRQLVGQFISETFIIALFAVVLSVGIAVMVLPWLNQLLEIQLNPAFIADPAVDIFLLTVIGGVTLLAGFYPALVLSGFNPITALKNKARAGSTSGISLRRSLVVLQFCIAQVLVIGTLVIVSQMDYFKNASLGFDKEAIVNVGIPSDSISHLRLNDLRNRLLQLPGIKAISYSFASPSDNSGWSSDFKYNNSSTKTDFDANLKWADADYFKLYNLKFVAGGPYTASDSTKGYVVNETLIKKLGVANAKDAIGKNIIFWDDKTKQAKIVGVIRDFNTTSLREQIPPVVMASWKDVYQSLNIKLTGVNVPQTLASVDKIWNNTFPDNVYDYQFLDKKVAKFYLQENQLSVLYKVFAGIAIFISCLGLYGLVSFMAIQRTKEVGIRKTLGASVSNIIYLFSKEFTVLIIIAFAISAPVGWYFMNQWLQDFSYKISIGPGVFILTVGVSVAIAWLTVGYKALRAAMVNPVTSLRSE